MSSTTAVKPDIRFVTELIDAGATTLKKCFQCGNCSAICELAPKGSPFPRKEMIFAQWGLKDRLLGSVDLWICHQCNDCSLHCPRGANPGDIMAAARKATFERFAPFGLGRFFSSPKYLPALIGAPMILIGIVLAIASRPDFLELNPIKFSNMAPVYAIDAIFLPFVALSVLGALFSIGRLWRAFKETHADLASVAPAMGALRAALKVITGILTHDKMYKCKANGGRSSYHLYLMYGFIGLTITTGFVALFYWLDKLGIADFGLTPLALSHPVKILGNVSALAALIGVSVIYARRFTKDAKTVGATGWVDLFFSTVLLVTIYTGILAELFRLLEIAPIAFGTYYIHLVAVFMLLVYLPFSKFAHMLYRFMALTFATMRQRGAAAVDL